jgi:hypothetical protein
LSVEETMTRIEKSLMIGRGRWIADFNESFRNFRTNDVTFDTLVRGNTRMKGFLLSRVFSATVNPNYPVACFMISTEAVRDFDRKFLGRLLHPVRSYIKENEVRWAWLVILDTKSAGALEKLIESYKDQFIGVVFIDVNSRKVVNNDSYIGKQAKRFIKI